MVSMIDVDETTFVVLSPLKTLRPLAGRMIVASETWKRILMFASEIVASEETI